MPNTNEVILAGVSLGLLAYLTADTIVEGVHSLEDWWSNLSFDVSLT
jgi:hypothetical protein